MLRRWLEDVHPLDNAEFVACCLGLSVVLRACCYIGFLRFANAESQPGIPGQCHWILCIALGFAIAGFALVCLLSGGPDPSKHFVVFLLSAVCGR